MPVTNQTLALETSLRRSIGGDVDDVTRQLVTLWASSWDRLYSVWYAATASLVLSGSWPGRMAVYRAVGGAAAATGEELRRLQRRVPEVTQRPVSNAATTAANAQPDLIRSQLPDTATVSAATAAVMAAAVNPAAPAAVGVVVAAILTKLAADVAGTDTGIIRAMRQTAAAGPHRGIQDPGQKTTTLMRRLEAVYNRSLTSALASARTAVSDAARDAARAAQDHNRPVLIGWQWVSRLAPNTCVTCWSLHGREFPLTTPGPRDHPNGQCQRRPVVKPWRLLGIDLPEPADVPNFAEARFRALPLDVQARIMGPTRLSRFLAGELTWADLTVRRNTRRISYKTRPLAA